jgi:glycosyltransferase involved in cell wall biosynthesis
MARRCPVIAADAASLPEVVEDAGYLVSPDNADQWAHAMTNLLDDESRREELAESGIKRAAEFTWSRAADVLEDSYRHALGTTL